MCKENPGLSRIIDAIGGIDELADLQQSGPHGTLASSNCSLSFTIVEKLVHDNGTSKTQQTELHSTNI